MDTTRDMALPNSADRNALKALVPALVEACPDMYEMACAIAREILASHDLAHLEPEQVYWHRFHAAQSSPRTFTGWEHLFETPRESMTLPQLVIQRFSVHDQDNADLLDSDAGFYTAGPDAGTYNETNEVKLHSREVLKAFWAINFADRYRKKVDSFWNKQGKTFRTLAKCTFLAKAMEDREGGRLSDDNFRTAVKAIAGNVSWPVTREMLEEEAAQADGLRIGLLKIDGFVATDILCITDGKGGAILYVPGEIWGVHALQNARDLHWWVLSQIRNPSDRKRFMSHFQVADHDIMEDTSWRAVAKRRWLWAFGPLVGGISELWRAPHIENVGLNHVLDLLVSTWDSDDHTLVAHTGVALSGDIFSFLATATHARMISDAEFVLHSNGDLRKKLWIGYLNAFNRVFGPMAAVGWPVALAVVGAGIANVGLQIDQAVNGKTPQARKAGVTGAIFAAIDTLFNATFIKGSGRLPEIAETETFIAPEEELAQTGLSVKPDEKLAEAAMARSPLPTLAEIAPKQVLPAAPEDFLASFKTGIGEGTRIETGDPKFQEIIQTASGKHYIYMRRAGTDGFYQVRYVEQMRGWFIIDPANPYSFYRNVPVRLNEALKWQPVARPGLRGGTKLFGEWPWGHTSDPLPEMATQMMPYDTSLWSRSALRPVAESHVDDFPLDSQTGSDSLYQDFKTLRRSLYDDAIDFYSGPNSPPRPAISPFKPATPFADMTKRLLKEAPGLVIGQDSTGAGARGMLIDNFKALNKQKVRTLYLDHLLSDFHQTDLDLFYKTGNMPTELENYLKSLDVRFDADPTGPHSYTELVRSAQKNHIRVQAIDCMASRRFPNMEHTSGTSSRKMLNYFSDTVIKADQATRGAHRWVALLDEGRASTFDKVAGLGELEGAPTLRVEEITVGQAEGLATDPGKKVRDLAGNPIDLLKSDLRLQLNGPPPTITARTVEEALPRRGMFMFKEPSTLIHRSSDGTLVKTAIQKDAGGFFIARPKWISVSGRHFDSVQELATALNDEGLTLRRVRIDPLAAEGQLPGAEPSITATGAGAVVNPDVSLPDTPLISSPYEIPVSYRNELKNATVIGNERTLGDVFVSFDADPALETFKMLRKQLREAATRFHAELNLAPRPMLAPVQQAASAESFIEKSLEQFNGLVVGESHADIGSKQWLIEQMPVLARKGVKTLYMEHLLTDFHQAALDNFARTSVMPRDLELYLEGLDQGHITDPTRRYTFLNLVKEANRQGVRVQAIDCMASYRLEGMRGLEATTRQKMMNFFAHTIIEADQAARGPHKWVSLMGNSHSNTYEGVAGVSELEDAIGLRIEDVGYGKSRGFEPDPGRTFLDDKGKPIGRVKGDMRLQMQTPWNAQTQKEIDQLLNRPGLYTLKQEPRSTLLVHRSRDNALVRTEIHWESGRYFIERPAWPALHEKRFNSVEDLLKALDDRGMTLAGWSGPL
ncbi:membrane-targeted effector domain-containing toxin [Pseudomonas sp. IzPS59]|uniref:membrane-targeted effector domain-containing toxin n=1 Tax=Pseudomonas sp. IzPS59 TaxID=2774459 RepID=UPI001787D9F2|nr:membrane-targeted effector domain-containing toxin [Pseudomonas sp. IzPS59]